MKHQIFWFLVIGTAGFIVDAGLTTFLHEIIGFHPVTARIPAILVAVFMTYLLNRHLTFKASTQNFMQGLLAYGAAQGLSQTLNYGVYTLLVLSATIFHDYPALAVAAGSVAAMTLSFILSRNWVFKPRGDNDVVSP